MAGTTGYNFSPNTKARSSEVNQNFEWFRGHYLPVTQSGTWANTSSVNDIGSSAFQWRDAYISGRLIIGGGIVHMNHGFSGSITLAASATTTINLSLTTASTTAFPTVIGIATLGLLQFSHVSPHFGFQCFRLSLTANLSFFNQAAVGGTAMYKL